MNIKTRLSFSSFSCSNNLVVLFNISILFFIYQSAPKIQEDLLDRAKNTAILLINVMSRFNLTKENTPVDYLMEG
jgi:hypothetical protein